jgi:integrase family protein with SAM-like domain
MRDSTRPMLMPPAGALPLQSTIETLALIPEEDVWLASRKSAVTRQAYAGDVLLFMRAVGITSREALRRVDHKAVIGWERHMREVQQLHPTTIRRRLAALSSLFRHLVKYGIVAINPVWEIERPATRRIVPARCFDRSARIAQGHRCPDCCIRTWWMHWCMPMRTS